MIDQPPSLERTRGAARKLFAYCRANDWMGYDPYDALNSRLLAALPCLDSRLPRLVLIQALKRSPINVRRLALIPKTQNPKAMALFLAALLKLSDADVSAREELIGFMIERLHALRSRDARYCCWGYSFPWQTRTTLISRGAPNLVCTTFVANALLDAYERRRDPRCLNMAVSAAEYIVNELYWTNGRLTASLSYPTPSTRTPIHNANFLGAALLCRVHRLTGDAKFRQPALKVARYSASRQRGNGSWAYGEAPTLGWIDNFHTGFNLTALQIVARELDTTEFDVSVRRGFEFYRRHFFREDGAPRYFHNRTYPIDIHSVAQSIITLVELRHLDAATVQLAQSVCDWAMNHMWDERGFFYYRVLRAVTVRISYMRWSQAWMLLAMSTLLNDRRLAAVDPEPARSSVA